MNTLTKALMTLLIITSIVIPAEAQVKFTKRIGGSNGSNFMIPSSRADILSTEMITGIAIQHSRRIEQIVVEYADDQDFRQVESAGNDSGKWSYIDLEEGEFITYITGRAGTLIDQITFHTSMRRTFGPYGGNGGNDFEISIPSNAKVIGFKGQSGPSINQIGLIYKIAGKATGLTKDLKRGTRYQGSKGSDVSKYTYQTAQNFKTNDVKKRTVRDHRSQKSNFTIRDSMRMVRYSTLNNNDTNYHPDSISKNKSTFIISKDFKPAILEMNGRGTKGPEAKSTNNPDKRKVRDHRKTN